MSSNPSLARRGFLKGAAALSFTGLLTPRLSADTSAARVSPRPHSMARIQLGRYTVTMIADGYVDFPHGAFTGIETAALSDLVERAGLTRPTGLRSSFTVWLIEDGHHRILVDSGPDRGRLPEGVNARTGDLIPALASLGLTPSDIDVVLLTHTHVDHISGLLSGGQAAFPRADIYVDRRDITHFTDPALTAAAPPLLQSSFRATADLVAAYPGLHRLDSDLELLPGLSFIEASGHTPGHRIVRIQDGSESMSLVGDLLFHPLFHPSRPEVGIAFEADPEAARLARQRFYAQAVDEAMWVAATHMPFPGLGRLVDLGGADVWQPADWPYPA